ncbi:hypothetical protein SY1_16650 [Fretibacterium fastidiosum]|uniref:Uncharacterized protein n=1 Tax=Fretibacterium fastidiosum TaxID=651822 RepID=A0AB94IY54_9BACT|nr:hypothetical protein SY1_16650 [Fretibacterium fastidiosum]
MFPAQEGDIPGKKRLFQEAFRGLRGANGKRRERD